MDFFPVVAVFVLTSLVWAGGLRILSLYAAFVNKKFAAVKKTDHQPKVTVMISCFNEGPAVYDTIKSIYSSNYPRQKLEIIAYDDCSKDDSFIWMKKAESDFPGVVVRKNIKNQGKAVTLTDIFQVSSGEIVIGTDSDTEFAPDAIAELVSCFGNPKVGAVGGWCGIKNVNDNVVTQIQAILYIIFFFMMKEGENVTRTVQCLGGPLVAIRREVYQSLIQRIKSFSFFGAKVTGGEDRFITQCMLFDGHDIAINLNAKCLVNTPNKWSAYLNQQLRWRRSAFFNFFRSLYRMVPRTYSRGFIATAESLIPAFTCLITYLFIGFIAWVGLLPNFLITVIILHAFFFPLFVWGVYNNFVRRRYPSQVVTNPIGAGIALGIWAIVSFLVITPFAIFTLDDGGWVTRN